MNERLKITTFFKALVAAPQHRIIGSINGTKIGHSSTYLCKILSNDHILDAMEEFGDWPVILQQ